MKVLLIADRKDAARKKTISTQSKIWESFNIEVYTPSLAIDDPSNYEYVRLACKEMADCDKVVTVSGWERDIAADTLVKIARLIGLEVTPDVVFFNRSLPGRIEVSPANEMTTLGWQPEGFFAFADGIIENGNFKAADSYGVTTDNNSGENYLLPDKHLLRADEIEKGIRSLSEGLNQKQRHLEFYEDFWPEFVQIHLGQDMHFFKILDPSSIDDVLNHYTKVIRQGGSPEGLIDVRNFSDNLVLDLIMNKMVDAIKQMSRYKLIFIGALPSQYIQDLLTEANIDYSIYSKDIPS